MRRRILESCDVDIWSPASRNVVLFGEAFSTAPASKGSFGATPSLRLRRRIAKEARTILVDENMTTKKHMECGEEVVHPEGWSKCPLQSFEEATTIRTGELVNLVSLNGLLRAGTGSGDQESSKSIPAAVVVTVKGKSTGTLQDIDVNQLQRSNMININICFGSTGARDDRLTIDPGTDLERLVREDMKHKWRWINQIKINPQHWSRRDFQPRIPMLSKIDRSKEYKLYGRYFRVFIYPRDHGKPSRVTTWRWREDLGSSLCTESRCKSDQLSVTNRDRNATWNIFVGFLWELLIGERPAYLQLRRDEVSRSEETASVPNG